MNEVSYQVFSNVSVQIKSKWNMPISVTGNINSVIRIKFPRTLASD